MRTLTTLGLAALLSACGSTEETVADTEIYLCGDVEAMLGEKAGALRLFLPEGEVPLELSPSGSGEKYLGQLDGMAVEFWEKGDRALLSIGATRYPECEQLP